MKKVIHFNSQEERLKYLKGGLIEVVPKKAESVKSDTVDAKSDEKPQKTASKPKKKKSKKEDK